MVCFYTNRAGDNAGPIRVPRSRRRLAIRRPRSNLYAMPVSRPKGRRGRRPPWGKARIGGNAPDLIRDVQRSLRSPDPIDLLVLVSGLVEVSIRQSRFSFDDGEPRATLVKMVESFIGVDIVETTALLTVISELIDDEPERSEARRELRGRTHVLPPWLVDLSIGAPVTMEMSHPYGDGEDIILGVRTAVGYEMTLIAYIDHNLGKVIKDGFIVPGPIEQTLTLIRERPIDPDMTLRELDPAVARARLEQAGERARRSLPPFESDTWPMCRPLVEWAARQLPSGGSGYAEPDWDEADTARLRDEFLSSPEATHLDADQRDLIDALLWFSVDYGTAEPLQWSPVRVEMFLVDWAPRKLLNEYGVLAKVPNLLSAFIRYSHRVKELRPELTEETLAAVDEWEPAYWALIRDPGLRTPFGYLAHGPWFDDPFDRSQIAAEAVGGEDALAALDDAPLPDEPFRWEGIPEDVRPQVLEVLDLCDAFCDAKLDVEHRTAIRRMLALVANGNPSIFRRKARAVTAAAALCWVIGRANGVFKRYWGRGIMLVKDMTEWFGLGNWSPSQRAETLLRAIEADRDLFVFHDVLGDPDLLVSVERHRLINVRDRDGNSA